MKLSLNSQNKITIIFQSNRGLGCLVNDRHEL